MRKQKSPSTFKPWSSEESFRLLVESLTDYAIFMLDASGRVASWNKGAERQFGYTERDILGHPYSILFTPEDKLKDAPEKEMEEAARNGRALDRRFHVDKEGHKFFVDGTLSPMRDEFGRVSGYIKLIHRMSDNV
jgi:PAS domain S-box-containing protein